MKTETELLLGVVLLPMIVKLVEDVMMIMIIQGLQIHQGFKRVIPETITIQICAEQLRMIVVVLLLILRMIAHHL
jgi:hypothetical protein